MAKTGPQDYLRIWPQVADGCMKYLKSTAAQTEYQQAFPAAFVTALYFEEKLKFRDALVLVQQRFDFLVRHKRVEMWRYDRETEKLLYYMSTVYLKLYDDRFLVDSAGSKGRIILNKLGRSLVEGTLRIPANRMPKTVELDIELDDCYKGLPNIEQIKGAVRNLYSATERLRFVPIPKTSW
ncbi:MAG: hypothetical protein ABH829_03350 [archaeon]